jgi:hypothetical protein
LAGGKRLRVDHTGFGWCRADTGQFNLGPVARNDIGEHGGHAAMRLFRVKRLIEIAPYVKPDWCDQNAQKERDAPTPPIRRLWRHNEGQRDTHHAGNDTSDVLTGKLPAAEKTLAAGWGRFPADMLLPDPFPRRRRTLGSVVPTLEEAVLAHQFGHTSAEGRSSRFLKPLARWSASLLAFGQNDRRRRRLRSRREASRRSLCRT